MKNFAAILIVLMFAGACATQRGPIIDTKGIDMMQYANDINE